MQVSLAKFFGGIVNGEDGKNKIVETLLTIYVCGSCISFLYFSWQYAQEHGLIAWLFFGEIVPCLQSLVWPYYLLKMLGS